MKPDRSLSWSRDWRRGIRGGRWLALCLGGALAGMLAAAEVAPAIVPRETLALFNGRDLTAFEAWVPGVDAAARAEVFTVVDVDGAPVLRASGRHFGGLVTRNSYANYRLVAEFRWGGATWPPRVGHARDGGILLHCQGELGNSAKTFDSPWMRSVEFQIIEGGTGDIILVGGYERGSAERIATRLTVSVPAGERRWDPLGTPTEFSGGRINWRHRDPAWTDRPNARGAKEVEKPVGEWNRCEAICAGGNVTYFLNGTKVNEGTNGSLTGGRLLIQSEGAEIYFRRFELHPLP